MVSENISFRETTSQDARAIRHVHEKAFGQKDEAELTIALLQDPTSQPLVSLLALRGSEPIGHILFSRVYLEGVGPSPLAHILAPLAVVPTWQGKGVGSQLSREGLGRIRAMGSVLCLVLGHPDYYRRLGFIPDAASQGLEAPYPISDKHADAWMANWLTPDRSAHWTGRIRCADALNKKMYWQE